MVDCRTQLITKGRRQFNGVCCLCFKSDQPRKPSEDLQCDTTSFLNTTGQNTSD